MSGPAGLGAALTLSVAIAASAGPAMAQAVDATTAPAYRMAYQSAMKCYVVNGVLYGDARDGKDRAKAAAYDAKAHASYDLAYQAGQMLGFSQAEVATTLKSLQDEELPKLMHDGAYFKRSAGECRQLGLL